MTKMPELKESPKFMKKNLLFFLLGGIVVAFFLFEHVRLSSNLKSSTKITQNLREELESLRKENETYLEQQKSELSKVQSLSAELNNLKEDRSLSVGRQEELKKLVSDAEKTLEAQNRKIAELEAKLKNAEQKMLRQKKASANLEQQTKSAKANPGTTQEYVKLVEGEWMAAMQKTQELKGDLDTTLSELSGYNRERSKLRADTATMHYNLAVILTEQRNYQAAILEYQKVLEIRPNDADAHYNLAILYDDFLKNNDKALEHYRQYIQVAPNAPESQRVRQWIKDKEYDTTFKFKL
jgi:tetratricopeptide (TPR) repeat protein